MSSSISERSSKLYKILNGSLSRHEKYRLFDLEPLLDAFFALYDILCSSDYQKQDKQVAVFVKKVKASVEEIRSFRPCKEDFEIIKTIGRGHFGEVHVVRERETKDIYAMKILKKDATLSNDNVAFYEEERDVMAFAGSPWVTSLQYAFQDPENLYLVMEFLPGGDLLNLLNRYEDQIMEESDAKFYIAEMVSAVHVIHNLGYVHRDIKPENILIDMTGHLKLADFGSAAKLLNNKKVLCKMPVGTPEYIAPEVLQSMNTNAGFYGAECDWWSVGVVCYEMLCGMVPFQADGILKLYSQIMNHKKSLTFPDDVKLSSAAEKMIMGLLDDQKDRLSYKDLAKHEFFSSIDWTTLASTKPPYIPQLKDPLDTSHFEKLTSTKISSAKPIPPTLTNMIPFIGFTFTKNISAVKEESQSSKVLVTCRGTEENDRSSAKLAQINDLLNQNIEQLNQKIRENETASKKLQSQNDILQKNSDTLKKTISEMENKLNVIVLERDNFQSRLDETTLSVVNSSDLMVSINNLTINLSAEKRRYDEACTERDSLKLRLGSVVTDLEAANAKIIHYEAKVKETDRNLQQNSIEFKASIDELQALLDKSTTNFQEKLRIANEETKKYREIVENHEDNRLKSERKESEELSYLNQQLQESATNHNRLVDQISELQHLLEIKDNELKNMEFLHIKYNQNIKVFESQVQQYEFKIADYEAQIENLTSEIKSLKVTQDEFLSNNQAIKITIEKRDQQIIELQESIKRLEFANQEERRRALDKFALYQASIDDKNSIISKKTNENTELNAQKRELEDDYKVLHSDCAKLGIEIDRLNGIVSAQKTSNFSLSQELEDAHEMIKRLKVENQDLNSHIITTTAFNKDQVYKLEATIAQQTKLINFLHTEQPKKKGGRMKNVTPDTSVNINSRKSIFGGANKRKDRDLENELEKERNQCIKLNLELDKLRHQLNELKTHSLSPRDSHVEHKLHVNSEPSITESTDAHSITITPHSFCPTTCYHPNICFVCLRPISFSQIILKCSICRILFHSSCQNYLPPFSCHLIAPLVNVEDLIDYTFLYRIYPELDAVKPKLPYIGCLSILNMVGNNKFDWRRHNFELSSEKLCIKLEGDDNKDETGTVNFAAMQNPCVIRAAVHTCDILFTPPTKVPFVFGIEINSSEIHNMSLYSNSLPMQDNSGGSATQKTNSNFNSILYLLAESLDDKRLWIRLLNDVIGCNYLETNKITDPLFKINTETFHNVTAIHPITEDIIMVAYSQGLAVINTHDNSIVPCLEPKIECHSLYQAGGYIFGLFDKSRTLYKLVIDKKNKIFSAASWKHKSKITLMAINNFSECLDIHYGDQVNDGIILYFTIRNELICARLNSEGVYVSHAKVSIGDVQISSLTVYENSIIVCQEKFYIYDLETKEQKEFLNAEDHSLAFIIYGSHSDSNYPMNVFLTNRTSSPEFLICCSEFGVIVDQKGQRLSGGDLRWDQIPLSFHYYQKTLVVCYPNTIELRNFDIESIANLCESTSSFYININCPIVLTQNNLNYSDLLVCNVNIEDYSIPIKKISVSGKDIKRSSNLTKKKSFGVSFKNTNRASVTSTASPGKSNTFLSRIIK